MYMADRRRKSPVNVLGGDPGYGQITLKRIYMNYENKYRMNYEFNTALVRIS